MAFEISYWILITFIASRFVCSSAWGQSLIPIILTDYEFCLNPSFLDMLIIYRWIMDMYISVSKLQHHPLNEEIYTLSNIDDLVQSIGDVGFLSPLVIDKKNQVIFGNRRLAAIRKLGWKKVYVEVADVPDEDVVGILIHHNKQRVKKYP